MQEARIWASGFFVFGALILEILGLRKHDTHKNKSELTKRTSLKFQEMEESQRWWD